MLLENGADVNAGTTENKTTPLIYAVNARHLESAKVLLHAGADPNLRSKRGQLPQALAAGLGHAALVQELLAHKADVNPPVPLLQTIIADSNPFVKPTPALAPQSADDTGPLHQTVLAGHAEIALLLLQAGANPNGREQDGSTPLFVAAMRADPALFRLLLAHKAGSRAADLLGGTPLHAAATTKTPKTLRCFLKAAPTRVLPTYTAIHLAIKRPTANTPKTLRCF